MRVFLTGVSGGLGSLLAERLARLPEIECITGIDVTDPKKPLPSKVQFVKMDIRSSDLAAVTAGHDTVVHTAFVGLWPAKMPAAVRDDINVNGVRNVAQAAVANRVRRFIHTSSTAAYDPQIMAGKTGLTEDLPLGKGDFPFYYSANKAAAERILTEILGPSGILLTVLRPCAFVGRNTPQTMRILRETAAKLPRRDPRAQFAHEEDVVGAFLQAVCSDMPGAFNVAPDDFIRSSEVWKIMKRRVLLVPSPLMRLFVAVRWRYFGSPIHPRWVEARMADFTASNAKLKATGWKPRYGSADALRTAV